MANPDEKRVLTEGEEKTLRNRMIEFARRFLEGRQGPPPVDPYSSVPAPLRRGPKDRSGAAVAEIEDNEDRSFPPRRY